MPPVALTVTVPDSDAPAPLPSASVIGMLVLVTALPPASRTETRTGAIAALASASIGCVVNARVDPFGGGTSAVSVSGSVTVADGLTSTAPAALPMAAPAPSSATTAMSIFVLTEASKRNEKLYAGGTDAPTGTVIVSLCPLPSLGVTASVAMGPTGADASPSSVMVTTLLPGAHPAIVTSASRAAVARIS